MLHPTLHQLTYKQNCSQPHHLLALHYIYSFRPPIQKFFEGGAGNARRICKTHTFAPLTTIKKFMFCLEANHSISLTQQEQADIHPNKLKEAPKPE
jgi:hypothetical protein